MTRAEVTERFEEWMESWNNHQLEKVMELLHENIVFEHWTGTKVKGKNLLRRAWSPWFLNHENFRFTTEETIFDEENQILTFTWRLDWPSLFKEFDGKPEIRQGVDILHFQNGKIIRKQSFSKTIVLIDNKKVAW